MNEGAQVRNLFLVNEGGNRARWANYLENATKRCAPLMGQGRDAKRSADPCGISMAAEPAVMSADCSGASAIPATCAAAPLPTPLIEGLLISVAMAPCGSCIGSLHGPTTTVTVKASFAMSVRVPGASQSSRATRCAVAAALTARNASA